MSDRLDASVRVRVWDAALQAVRDELRGVGLREVFTPVRVAAPAIEPYIEPIAAPPGFLATSPELAMKRLRCAGAGPVFQIAPCFRAGEVGALHREEFHLVEWYRDGEDLAAIRRDVEALVDRVFDAVGQVLARPTRADKPTTWVTVGFLELVERVVGLRLRGDESAAALRALVRAVDPVLDPGPAEDDDGPVPQLQAWCGFFSRVCDGHLDPWLVGEGRAGRGVHVAGFPPVLGALAVVVDDGAAGRALRVESHVLGRELANGYVELRDAREQRLRFERVNALRVAQGRDPLPLDSGFLSDLEDPGLPPTTGCALGLERLIMLACGARSVDAIGLEPDRLRDRLPHVL